MTKISALAPPLVLLVSIAVAILSLTVDALPSTSRRDSYNQQSRRFRVGYAGRPKKGSSRSQLPKRATTCNGSGSLCDRSYGNVTFAGAHNSYAIASSGTQLASNQNVSIAGQLNAGIRLLQSQAHNSSNTSASGAGVDLCHTSCSIFQGGSLENYLGQVKSWVDQNPTEVITLLIVNSDGITPSRYAQAFESTGLASKMYQPTSATTTRNSWPTLGTMIDSGKTVVGFLSTEADFSSVNYLLDEFSNIWETPYDQTTAPFNCSIDRIGQGISDSSQLMYLSNQFLDTSIFGSSSLTTPDTDALGSTNSIDTTVSTSYSCAGQHNNVNPNFVLTDYSTVPDYGVMRAVAQLNGVSYTPPSSSEEGGSDSSSGSQSFHHFEIASSFFLPSFVLAILAFVL